jgi:hypothetical protein
MNPVIPFLTAIALSGIAGYYSIIGLALIFPGSFWPIVIMGGTLEVAKLVTVAWLYRNWKNAPMLLKVYFSTAVIILMLITSMGIFGYLSKAHIETSVTSNANVIELRALENEEKLVNERLSYLLKRAGDPATASRRIDAEIKETQTRLKEIAKQKIPLLQEENRTMADVGPIRYIAEFLYDKNDSQFIDKAVRIVIFVIIFVFDPLAVLLLIAANINMRKPEEPVVPVQKKKTASAKVFKGSTLEPWLSKGKTVEIPENRITKIDKEI